MQYTYKLNFLTKIHFPSRSQKNESIKFHQSFNEKEIDLNGRIGDPFLESSSFPTILLFSLVNCGLFLGNVSTPRTASKAYNLEITLFQLISYITSMACPILRILMKKHIIIPMKIK
jgi:hypothetical protein